MLKHEEALNPQSCFNRAKDNEPVFVLLGRDMAAPAAISTWIAMRRVLGLNTEALDEQIIEAEEAIKQMNEWRVKNQKANGKNAKS